LFESQSSTRKEKQEKTGDKKHKQQQHKGHYTGATRSTPNTIPLQPQKKHTQQHTKRKPMQLSLETI
jgi:hypothetical protein